MKKFALVSVLLIAGAAHGQDLGKTQFSLQSPLEQFKSNRLASLDLTNSQSMALPFENTNSKIDTKSRGLMFKNSALSSLNFSKNDKIQYGFKLEVDQFFDPFSFEKRLEGRPDDKSFKQIKTSAFLNYKIAADYSLNASVSNINGNENGRLFSVGAKAKKFFNRKHAVTTMFSVNWGNITTNPWNQLDKSLNANLAGSNDRFSMRPDVRLGATWNWTINNNWSLSTGVSARHFMNDVNKNPFATQRSSVTIFSVASYRF
ncbi:MipA/OmpV family protein [Undibacterium sp. LX40W]|uniref:MipA/OmpV family protein n=1 Tax=Undibacterium nitidum TaxID=2762298 RepID=A0A923HQM7_9BURK|nr:MULTISPECIES: MipA/OmpV family protein [Undibacterium]MBC3882291.1 MipA/OmpV family protein [Undibacterium nitidum]MBC3892572.1 MipA/OmpV family protein [Undibacterium sp. LX40W]